MCLLHWSITSKHHPDPSIESITISALDQLILREWHWWYSIDFPTNTIVLINMANTLFHKSQVLPEVTNKIKIKWGYYRPWLDSIPALQSRPYSFRKSIFVWSLLVITFVCKGWAIPNLTFLIQPGPVCGFLVIFKIIDMSIYRRAGKCSTRLNYYCLLHL